MEKFRVGIIGAETKQGAQLCRLLAMHPYLDITSVYAAGYEGKRLSTLHPSLRAVCENVCADRGAVIDNSDVVFSIASDMDTDAICAECIHNKCVFIDLSACFRPNGEEAFLDWFGYPSEYPGLHNAVSYGLPELLRSEIVGKVLISVPGAIAAAAGMAMAPALLAGMLYTDSVCITAIASENTPFSSHDAKECTQLLSQMAAEPVNVCLVDRAVRTSKGLTVVCTAKLKADFSQAHLEAAFNQIYGNEPFVRIVRDNEISAANVLGSNMTDVSVRYDEATNFAVFTAAFDDTIKGGAGLALQAMNVMLSIPETTGLELYPDAF